MSTKENNKPEVFAEIIEFGPDKEVQKSFLPVFVEKDSQQVDQSKYGTQWSEPRLSFYSLFKFLDTNIWHKRCIYLKAALVCGLGWDLVTEDDNVEPDTDYAMIKQLLENPNTLPIQTFQELCFRAMVDYYSVGNLFLEVPRNLKGRAAEIYHVRAVTMKRSKNLKKGFWQVFEGSTQEFRAWGQPPNGDNEIIHHYAYDPLDAFYGIAEWIPALADIVLDRNVIEYIINLFANQLMAKFTIIIEGGKLSDGARTKLQEYLSKNFHGLQNAGRTIILDSDDPGVKIRIEKLEVQFGDKEGFKGGTRTVSRDNVIGAHGVPPRLLAISQAGQLGGGNENEGQLTVFKETVIDPDQKRFEDLLNNTVIKSFGNHKWKIKFKEFNTTNLESISNALSTLVGTNIYDVNEAREELGKPARTEDELAAFTNQVISLRKRLELEDGK